MSESSRDEIERNNLIKVARSDPETMIRFMSSSTKVRKRLTNLLRCVAQSHSSGSALAFPLGFCS